MPYHNSQLLLNIKQKEIEINRLKVNFNASLAHHQLELINLKRERDLEVYRGNLSSLKIDHYNNEIDRLTSIAKSTTSQLTD